jgi:hypothetical protein
MLRCSIVSSFTTADYLTWSTFGDAIIYEMYI